MSDTVILEKGKLFYIGLEDGFIPVEPYCNQTLA